MASHTNNGNAQEKKPQDHRTPIDFGWRPLIVAYSYRSRSSSFSSRRSDSIISSTTVGKTEEGKKQIFFLLVDNLNSPNLCAVLCLGVALISWPQWIWRIILAVSTMIWAPPMNQFSAVVMDGWSFVEHSVCLVLLSSFREIHCFSFLFTVTSVLSLFYNHSHRMCICFVGVPSIRWSGTRETRTLNAWLRSKQQPSSHWL